MSILYSLLFFFTPLIFTSFNSELFELPKMYFVYAITTVIFTLHFFNYIKGKAPLFRHTLIDLPLILFLVSQIISTIFSVDPHTSIFGYYSRLNGGLLSTICYLTLYWILAVYINPKLKSKIINISLFSGILISGFGILEHFGIDKNIWIQDVQARVFSTLGQPNWLAAYLCILLPFSIAQSLNSLSSKKLFLSKIFYLTSTILFICLLFTKSKSGIIAAIISTVIFCFLYFLKNKKNNLLALISYLFLFTILTLSVANPIKDKIFPAPPPSKIQDLQSNILITPSEDIRKIVWRGAIDLWKKYPIFGTGVESFAYTYYWTRPASHNLTSEWDFLYNKAHNEYINFLATTGTFGLITYLLIILVIFISFFKNYSDQNIAIISGFISILITNISGFSVVITYLYFFLLPALLLSDHPQPRSPKSRLYLIPIILVAFLLLQKTLYFYLADITYAQASSSNSQNQLDSAYKNIKISLFYRPDEPQYLIELSGITTKLAVTTKQNKYISESIDSSTQALNISPANVNFWKERAQNYYYLSTLDPKYFQDAIDSLLKAALLAPTDAKIYFLLGQFLENSTDLSSAIKYYQKAIDLKPNYDHATFALGVIYFEQKNYSLAKKYFESTISIAPNNQQAKDYLNQISKLKISQ